MGTSLTGLTPANTYDALIKVGDNGPIDGTLKTLSDGLGNDLPMQASSTVVNFTNGLQQSGVAVPTAAQVAGKQDTLVSGTNIKTVNSTSLVGSGDIAVQATLVSGTNIKTINSTSLLGSGDIVLSASPSGVSGAIQFSNGSAFASDASNLFWDDTNNRLGIGTNAPTTALQIDYASSTLNGLLINQTGGTGFFSNIGFANGGTIRSTFGMNLNSGEVRWFNSSGGYFATIYGNGVEAMRIDGSQNVNIGATALGARVGIKGSGSTSATTSLLVQTSAGLPSLQVFDNRTARINGGTGNGLTLEVNGTFEVTSASYQRGGIYGNGGIFAGMNSGESVSAILQADSTTKGFLPPRMTTTQKNAIATPASGLVVYDSTMNATCEYTGTAWRVVSAGAQSVAASTATTTVDMSAGNVQNITLTASTTFTLSSAAIGTYILKLIQGGSGSYTATWPASVKWSGGTAPTLTTTVGKLDIVTLVFDGTNYYGTYSLNY